MPESTGRPGANKPSKHSGDPATRAQAQGRPEPKKQRVGNPSWWVPVMSGLMIAGVLWVSTFYITQGALPAPIGYWNLAIGMSLIMVGFLMSTRWK
ncbi:cell division protein CrgA [Ornithinimicrobium sediminis]|uniref:cell division protein CrgA n=1 Tax=Ornithinimicrobium sediminis TaxID=2904603 RepID=UPI001E4061B7|nr:cell division protein CrgA [Ornithinimicrobium sediminis]